MSAIKNKSLMRTLLCAVSFALSLGLLRADVVYVAAELPEGSDGSGSSWANAMVSISAACEKAKTNGGEVWLKSGVYLLEATTPLYSGLKIRGGFAGLTDETSSDDADPKSNPTIITSDKDGTGKWGYKNMAGTYIPSQVPVREGLSINLPPDDLRPESEFSVIVGYYNPAVSCFSDTSGNLTDVAVSGITFCALTASAIEIASGTKAEISNCRFAACNSYAQDSYGGIKSKGILNVSNCEFIGCNSAINQGEGAGGTDNTVSDCVFFSCGRGKSVNRRAGIHFWVPASRLKISRCVFKSCREVGYFGCAQGSVMEDCLIEDCRASSYYFNIDIDRCVFRANTLNCGEINSGSVQGIVDLNGANLILRDTLFERNSTIGELADGATAQTLMASCVTIMQNSDKPVILNCSFVSNSVVTATESDLLKKGCVVLKGKDLNSSVALVNCAFKDNRGAADLCCFNQAGASFPDRISVAVVNSIFSGADESYVPFEIDAEIKPFIANSNIMNFDRDPNLINEKSPLSTLTALDPKFAGVRTGNNGVSALMLKSESPLRKAGCVVYRSQSGEYWIKAPETLWKLRCMTYFSAIGQEEYAALSVDAWGQPREEGRIALGPVNPAPLGFKLIVR